jgi:hypothetical protein
MLFPHGDACEGFDERSFSPLLRAMPPRLAMLRARTPGVESMYWRGVQGNQVCESGRRWYFGRAMRGLKLGRRQRETLAAHIADLAR